VEENLGRKIYISSHNVRLDLLLTKKYSQCFEPMEGIKIGFSHNWSLLGLEGQLGC
jgi:hypothetical protein